MPGGTYSACADELCLLAPYRTRAREDPCGTDIVVVLMSTNDGGIPVSGERDRKALVCQTYCARAGQFRALLAPHPARAREHPLGAHRQRGKDTFVVIGPTAESETE